MIETEVKFAVPTLAPTVSRLAKMGVTVSPRVFERNRVYDTPDGRLRQSGELVRLREDDGVRLTHKSPLLTQSSDAKQMRELEVTVSDAATMDGILEAMGYTAIRRYEKYRQVVVVDTVHVCLDSLPFGDFIELEGAVPSIQAVAGKLNLSWRRRILYNYLTLFEQWCRQLGLVPRDITFEDLKGDYPGYHDLFSDTAPSAGPSQHQ